MKKILVTGGAGFIGSQVVDFLCQRHQVTVIDSFDAETWPQRPTYLNREITYHPRDLRHGLPNGLTGKLLGQTQVVIHLAALGGVSRATRQPHNVLDANVAGTARLVEAITKWPDLERVIFAGSFSVYGKGYDFRVPSTGRIINGERRLADIQAGRFGVYDEITGEEAQIIPITEAATPHPLEVYAQSKYLQELCLAELKRVPVTTLRFSSVFGPRLREDDGEATIIARLIGWIRQGIPPKLFEDGRQRRDWVYVGDIIDAIDKIIDGAACPPIVNVCSGTPTSLLDACTLLNHAFNSAVIPEVTGECRPGDMRDCLGDTTCITTLLGRQPTSFADGIKATLVVN